MAELDLSVPAISLALISCFSRPGALDGAPEVGAAVPAGWREVCDCLAELRRVIEISDAFVFYKFLALGLAFFVAAVVSALLLALGICGGSCCCARWLARGSVGPARDDGGAAVPRVAGAQPGEALGVVVRPSDLKDGPLARRLGPAGVDRVQS